VFVDSVQNVACFGTQRCPAGAGIYFVPGNRGKCSCCCG
jgi:hypothetical protein